jgi:hypothetical protein
VWEILQEDLGCDVELGFAHIAIRIVHDDQLGWDVDHPDDLAVPEPSFVTDLLESDISHDRLHD